MMMLSEAGKAMHATLTGNDAAFDSVEIDSRRLDRNSLFFAIHGDTANGHDFIGQALENGAVAVVVDEVFTGAGEVPHLSVENTTRALGELAASWRQRFEIPVIGVTGSNGKTTVCGILKHLFEQEGPAIAPRGSFNNHWGVPLTLLQLRREHRSAIIEMGMNHAGELDYLGSIVEPTIGLITNAAAAHLEGLGSIERVAEAKGELIDHVRINGAVVLNRDDPFYGQWRARAGKRRVVSFGRHPKADVRLLSPGEAGLTLEFEGAVEAFRFGLLGRHNRMNAAAAVAVALTAGLSLESISHGLQQVRAVQGRLEMRSLSGGRRLINDTYNANPASMRAAIDVLADQPGQLVLVLGAMAELGEASTRVHEEVAAYAAERGIDRLLTLVDRSDSGYLEDMAAYLRGFGQSARAFSSVETLVDNLLASSGSMSVLVKGSRSAGMERVVEAILKQEGNRK